MSDVIAEAKPESDDGLSQPGIVTRDGLAQALKVSVRTVDEMVALGEIPVVRIRGAVRFYLPDVVRALTATALTSKRGCARGLANRVGSGALSVEGPRVSRGQDGAQRSDAPYLAKTKATQ